MPDQHVHVRKLYHRTCSICHEEMVADGRTVSEVRADFAATSDHEHIRIVHSSVCAICGQGNHG